jgi:poly(3-hydroxybutyrate) depolymerase
MSFTPALARLALGVALLSACQGPKRDAPAGTGGAGGSSSGEPVSDAAPNAGGSGGVAPDSGSPAADRSADLSGSSSADAAVEGGRADAPPASDRGPSPACAAGAMVPGPNGAQTIMVTGKSRRFIIRMPGGYDGKKPLPVIFAFHGAGGNGASFETGVMAGLSRMAADRALRVFPDALGGTWSRDEKDDVMFIDAIIEWMSSRVCYDTGRIFVTGQSSGAYFANRVACDRTPIIRAVATNSGGQRREYPLGPCKAPAAAWLSNGASDNPGHVWGTQQARDEWLKTNHCAPGNPMPTSPAPCVSYPGCPAGYAVHYCQHPGGHGFPGYATGGIFNFFFNSGL